ncbi:MAG: NADH-quinone oxidoreductase subunit M [Magnetococcales bacterium]|nr:NADH-quinone oxidoreductase subunit M [Magnetococcales bacterium]MBF0437813.1 NADH-quinone oxidoreductase subunit M [Magnetococcales bacterium]
MNSLPFLSLLIALPLLGAVLAWFAPNGRWARSVALSIGFFELILAIKVVFAFDPNSAAFQLIEKRAWIPSLNSHYHVGIDGLSVLFLPMTALLFIATLIAGWSLANRMMPHLYFALLLFFEGVTMGIFCALDTMLFFLFWELTLIPIYFLVSLWGIGPNRRYAALKYTLFMLAGGAPLLFGLLLSAMANSGQPLLFDLVVLLQNPLPIQVQWPVFFLLLIGFGVKVPFVPLHAWLPTIAMEGPVAITAIMTGLKLGAYGLIRFLMPLTSDVAHELHWLLEGIAVVAIVYGALAALVQSNLRRMLAFSSISHVGLVVLGVASFSLQGVQGALYQLLNFSLTSGGIFLLAGFLHQRLGSTDLTRMGGLIQPIPLATGMFLLMGLASMGIPLTSGFPGEFLLLVGALQHHIGSGLAALGGVILGAGYFLRFYRRAFLGPLGPSVPERLPSLLPREMLILITFAILILVGGWFPSIILDIIFTASQNWLDHINYNY